MANSTIPRLTSIAGGDVAYSSDLLILTDVSASLDKKLTPAGLVTAINAATYVQTADQAHPGSAGLITVAHGLSSTPTMVQMYAKNATTEGNWSVGNYFPMPGYIGDNGYGATLYWDSTNIYARFSANGTNANTRYQNKTTGGLGTMTDANWNFFFRAWL